MIVDSKASGIDDKNNINSNNNNDDGHINNIIILTILMIFIKIIFLKNLTYQLLLSSISKGYV